MSGSSVTDRSRRGWFAAAAWLTFLAAALLASPAEERPASPWKVRPEKFRLATGQDCLYQADNSSAMTVIEIFILGGKSAVPPGQDGLAFLATRIALEIPDLTVAQDVMAQATRMRVSVLEDCSIISLECLSENLKDALRVASEIVQNPLISGLRVDNLKRVMSLYEKAEEDDAGDSGKAAAFKAFFQGRGYGSSNYGSDSSRKAIDRKGVSAFYAKFFSKSGIFFSVCSDLGKEVVVPLLETSFSKLPARPVEGPAPTPPSLPEARKIAVPKDAKQAYVARAFLLPPPTTAAFTRGYLLEVLLGVGPGSRLWDLRAAGKLAYNVGARSTWMKGCGVLEAYLETDKAKKEEAAAALDAVLGDLHRSGVTEEELKMTRNLARARLLRTTEAKRNRAQLMGLLEVLGPGLDELSGIYDRIEVVTIEDLNAFIRDILDPEKSILVTIGGPGAY
jgi:predicted Zn-dependent peptidase